MTRIVWLGVLALGICAVRADRANADEQVKISLPVMRASFAPFFVAADKGYYREEGLDPVFLPYGGGVSIPGLIAGSLDVSASSFSATVAIMKGAPLRVVLVTDDRTAAQLWSFDPAVRTLADLKGRIIAIGSRGDSEEVKIRRVLADKGFPAGFVGFTAMGVGSARVSSVIAGAQRFSILNALELDILSKDGMLQKGTLLFDFSKGFQTAVGGMAVRADDLATHRDRIKRILRATWKGMQYVQAFREQSLKLLQKRFPAIAPDMLAVDFDSMRQTLNVDGDLSPDGAAEELAAHAQVLGVSPNQTPSLAKVYDFSLLYEVKQELAAEHWKPQE